MLIELSFAGINAFIVFVIIIVIGKVWVIIVIVIAQGVDTNIVTL